MESYFFHNYQGGPGWGVKSNCLPQLVNKVGPIYRGGTGTWKPGKSSRRDFGSFSRWFQVIFSRKASKIPELFLCVLRLKGGISASDSLSGRVKSARFNRKLHLTLFFACCRENGQQRWSWWCVCWEKPPKKSKIVGTNIQKKLWSFIIVLLTAISIVWNIFLSAVSILWIGISAISLTVD